MTAQALAQKRRKVAERNKRYVENNPWVKHYKNALGRCRRPSNKTYDQYGGRGIEMRMKPKEVKALWFQNRASAMIKPELHRLDANGNYETGNVEFLPRKQNRNTVHNRRPSPHPEDYAAQGATV